MNSFLAAYLSSNPVLSSGIATRSPGYTFVEDWAREAITPTGFPTIYTNAETGAGGTSVLSATLNAAVLTTDTNAGDDQDMRTSGLRIQRNYISTITGMLPRTTSVQLDIPFSVDAATDGEAFIGLHTGVAALTALPTTARHLGLFWDISVGANFRLTSSNGTTQVNTDTTVAVDAAIHILRIIWNTELTGTLALLTAGGTTEGTGQTFAAFNGTSGVSHEAHWFIQAEAGGARALTCYPYRVVWT